MMLAEMAQDPENWHRVAKRATKFVMLLLSLPGTLVGALLVRPVLHGAGSAYTSDGSMVLIFGLVGLIPAAPVDAGSPYRVAPVVYSPYCPPSVSCRRSGLSTIAFVADQPWWIGAVFLLANFVTLLTVRIRHEPT